MKSSDLHKSRQKTGRSKVPPRPRLHFCGCHVCAQCTCADPATGLPMNGRFISTAEVRVHQSESRSISGPSQLPSIRHHDSLLNPRRGSSRSSRRQEAHQIDPSSVADVLVAFSNLEMTMSIPSNPNLYKKVVFANMPTPGSGPPDPLISANDHTFDLHPTAPENIQLVHHRDQIIQSLKFVSESKGKYGSLSTNLRLKAVILERFFEKELTCIETSLRAEWDRQRWVLSEVGDSYVDMTPYDGRRFLEIEPNTLATYLIVLVLHSLCGLSMEHCKFALSAMNILSGLNPKPISRTQGGAEPPKSKPITDIRTVEKILTPEISPERFVCCPKCSYLYPFQRDKDGLYDTVPEMCTNQLHPDSEPCSRKLWNRKKIGGVSRDLPTREFLYQSMKHWLAWMYSRPDIEKFLDEDPTSRREPKDSSELYDIWDAHGLRNFKGPGGKSPFYRAPKNEARLIFSLNMDGFNPYTNKEAGKKVSTGGIYMVCLNLPRSIRYKEENIYLVGIIPGPHEPSTQEINYLLKPLVDELLVFWDPGFFYSHTPAHPQGRWIRCAIVPLVSDLPASRQMTGSAHYTSDCFCSYCWQRLADINDLDYLKWDARTMDSHRTAGEKWLRAPTQAKRDSIYSELGARWSELLRLPYWDPVQFAVIDPMHAFYLRIIAHHCRDIWGMDSSLPDAEVRRKETDPTDREIKDANIILRTGTSTRLKALSSNVLRELCIGTGTLKTRGRKNQLYARLVEYRNVNGWPAADTLATQEDLLDEEALDTFNSASKSAMQRLNKEKLLRLLKVSEDSEGADYSQSTRAELLCIVQETRQRRGIIDEEGKVLLKKVKAPKGTAVLGKETLAEVRADMARTTLPSWFSHAPKHPGDKKWGKLTASNWRSFALVNLPITLIRLWGNEPKSSRKRQMLDNYLHLVAAIKIATMRSTNASHIARYQEHIHAYLTSLLVLYPKTSITPYQHLSLHFSTFLERFGPTHAWQCFPFERYNHSMQQIPTNQKFGEMEKTMFRKFRLAQLVRSFFSIPNLPLCLQQLTELCQTTFSTSDISAFVQFTKERDHGTLPHDPSLQLVEEEIAWSDKDLVSLSSAAYMLLKQWLSSEDDPSGGLAVSPLAFSRRHIVRLGHKFATQESSPNNSHVLFHPRSVSQERGSVQVGSIQQIFTHTRTIPSGETKTQTFVVIAPLKELPQKFRRYDLYREIPLVANRLFEREVGSSLLIPLEQVIGHFAYVPLTLQVAGASHSENRSLDCVVAYPLDL